MARATDNFVMGQLMVPAHRLMALDVTQVLGVSRSVRRFRDFAPDDMVRVAGAGHAGMRGGRWRHVGRGCNRGS